MDGRKKWYIPDGWIPRMNPADDADFEGHEAVIILNCNEKPANVVIDIYFEDKHPIEGIKIAVDAKRVKCLRMDKPQDLNGVEIPRLYQYSVRISSDIDVVVQFGRMDITQKNLAYIGTIAYSE
jgi:hypothetical protein